MSNVQYVSYLQHLYHLFHTCSFSYFVFLLLLLLAVHAKSIVAILHLLVALSQHFRAPIRLPDHVSIQVVVVQVGVTLCLKACYKFTVSVYLLA